MVNARGDEIGMHKKQDDADAVKFTFGHSFIHVYWDKEAGPIHPSYRKLKDSGKDIPIIDKKTGKPIKGKKIQSPVKVGDVNVEVLGPDRVFPEIGPKSWEKVNEVDIIEWKNKWELKAEYPKVADSITEEKGNYLGYELNDFQNPDDMIMVKTFYHKKTKWLPKGAKIIWIDDVILSEEDYPFDEECLPLIPDTDIDIYGELWGRSFISNIEQQQRMYNNIESGQARDYGIGSAPKWLVPYNSTKVSSLNNEFTMVEYKGAIAPKLATSNPTNSQGFEFKDRLERRMGKFARVYDISRGEVPQGITANSALRFLDEQESQVIFPMQEKRKKRIVETQKMVLRRMQQFYKESEDRMIRTIGKNNEFMIESFKGADFSKIYDIRIQNQSALPDTKSGKINSIVDLNMSTQTDPIFRKEEIVNMLDLGLDEAFVDGATVAVTAAKTVVQSMLEGKPVPEPSVCDNFLVYYAVIDKTIQSFAFRKRAKDSTKKAFELYLTVLEGLMYERAMKNAKFTSELLLLNNYPMYFNVPEPLTIVAQKHAGGLQAEQPDVSSKNSGADTSKIKPKQDNKGE